MFKNYSNHLSLSTALIMGLVLVGCSASTSKLPVLNEAALSGSAANGFIRVAKTQRIRVDKVKKLVIPSFNVTYKLMVEGKVISVSEDGLNKITTNIKVNMENPNITMMQRVTNKAYNIFVDEMKKANFEVVSIDEVSKSEAYSQVNHKKLVTSISPDDENITLVADGLKFYDPDEKMDPDGGFWMGVSNVNSAVNGDLVDKFGGADAGVAAVNVNMTVQFGNFDLDNHRISASIAFNPSFTAIVADGTNMEVITQFKSVSMPGRVFYIPEESAMYSLNQDLGSRTNVIAGIQEVNSTENSKEYTATINEAGFEKAGVEQIERLSQLFVKAMKGQ